MVHSGRAPPRPAALPATKGQGRGGGRAAQEDGAGDVSRHVGPAEKILQGPPHEGPG